MLTNIKQHIAKVKANTRSYIEPMPEVPLFSSFRYGAAATLWQTTVHIRLIHE